MTLRPFDFLRHHLRQTVGIAVEPEKVQVFQSRLSPLAQARGFDTVAAMIEAYVIHRDPTLWRDIVEAVTINETYFFRDRRPFTLFREDVLPALLDARRGQRRLRIWCAACSTGQEPYSLAMILDEEARHLKGWRVEILATDLSDSVLQRAGDGSYSQFEVQRGLPVAQLLRYFNRDGERWRLTEHIRSRVSFRRLNLLDDFRDLGQFDVIFCRNVLIYFETKTKQDVLGRLRHSLRDDGYLVLGAAETVLGLTSDWQPHSQHPALIVPVEAVRPARPALRLVSNI